MGLLVVLLLLLFAAVALVAAPTLEASLRTERLLGDGSVAIVAIAAAANPLPVRFEDPDRVRWPPMELARRGSPRDDDDIVVKWKQFTQRFCHHLYTPCARDSRVSSVSSVPELERRPLPWHQRL